MVDATIIGGYDLSSIGTSALNNVMWIIAIGGFIGILAVIAYLISQWKTYDIQVRIYSKRKNGYKTWDVKGAYLKHKKTGEAYGFKLQGTKNPIQPPPLEFLIPNSKGQNTLHLLQLSLDEYFVLEPIIDDPMHPDMKLTSLKLKVIEGDIALWGTTMIDKIYLTYDKKNWWDKYKAEILFFVAVTMIFLIFYFFFQKLDVLKDLGSSMQNVAESLKQTALAMRDIHASGVAVPVQTPAG